MELTQRLDTTANGDQDRLHGDFFSEFSSRDEWRRNFVTRRW
jgi:hypothetical protein